MTLVNSSSLHNLNTTRSEEGFTSNSLALPMTILVMKYFVLSLFAVAIMAAEDKLRGVRRNDEHKRRTSELCKSDVKLWPGANGEEDSSGYVRQRDIGKHS